MSRPPKRMTAREIRAIARAHDKPRCRARFVEANGQWHRCRLNADGHDDHIALLEGRTFYADIRWHRRLMP